MSRRLAVVLLLSVLSPAISAETARLTVQTVDGNQLVGQSSDSELTLETGLGPVVVPLANVVRILVRGGVVEVQARDGSILKGKLALPSLKVQTQLGAFDVPIEKIAVVTVVAPPAPAPPAVPPSPPQAPASTAPAVPAPAKPRADATLLPVRELKVDAPLGGLALSPDGKTLWVLDVKASKVLVVDALEMKLRSEIALSGPAAWMTVSPDGSTLATADGDSVNVVDLAKGGRVAAFRVEKRLVAIRLLNAESLLGLSEDGVAVVISVSKRAIVKSAAHAREFLCPLPDLSKFYARDASIRVRLSEKGYHEVVDLEVSPYPSPLSIRTPMSISQDGCYGVDLYGKVMRLGRSYLAEAVDFKEVPKHVQSVFIKGQVLLFKMDGQVLTFSVPAFEPRAAETCGMAVSAIVVDEKGGFLYVIGTAPKSGDWLSRSPDPGNLYKFKIPY